MVKLAKRTQQSDKDWTRSSRDIVVFVFGIVTGIIGVSIFNGGEQFYNTTTIPTSTSSSTTGRNRISLADVVQSTNSATGQLPTTIPQGFHPIWAYYGKFHHITDYIPEKWWLESSDKHKGKAMGGEWFGQHGQDVAVAKFFNFKREGFFVDLASNDAVWASNTFALEQNFGWRGICIEPNPMYWYRLSFRNCHVVGSIVGGETNVEVDVVLGEAHHGPYGGIVGSDFDNKKLNKKDDGSNKRYTVSLVSILQMFNAPNVIDYLSLDVEGAETYIMKGFPFDKYMIKCLTIERPKDELKSLLETNGYKHVLDFKRGDTLWAHESFYEEGKKFATTNANEIDDHKVRSSIPGYS